MIAIVMSATDMKQMPYSTSATLLAHCAVGKQHQWLHCYWQLAQRGTDNLFQTHEL